MDEGTYSYDDEHRYFRNKAQANTLADRLAPELGINRKSLIVEGKKGEFHLLNAYINRYFTPDIVSTVGFEAEIGLHKKLVKEAMQ